jgi:hypothetical protein
MSERRPLEIRVVLQDKVVEVKIDDTDPTLETMFETFTSVLNSLGFTVEGVEIVDTTIEGYFSEMLDSEE